MSKRGAQGLWGLLAGAALVMSLAACHYYEDFRIKKATADLTDEKAELLHSYRLCLEKYEEEPAKARERCAGYAQTLRDIDTRHAPAR